MISNIHKKNPLQVHIPYFDFIALDKDFILELSETSDNRPLITTSTNEIQITPHNTNIQIQDQNELLSDTSESQVQYSQQSLQITQRIIQQPLNVQFENLSLQLDDNHDYENNQDELKDPNPALDTHSTDPTIVSNAVLVPVRNVEEQNLRHNTEQDPQYLIQGSSTLSTTNTNIKQTPIQSPISRNCDPPSLLESDKYTSSSTSQQSSTFINNINGRMYYTRPRFTFPSPSTPGNTSVATHSYTQTQTTSDPNIPTIFNKNLIHTNLPPNIVNSRPALQTIPTNPLQYNLSSTNTHTTQHFKFFLQHNTQTTTSSSSIQYQNIAVPSTSSIITKPYFTPNHKIQQTKTIYEQIPRIQFII